MIIVIDNYDSFVHNLGRYLRLAGAETEIVRNDTLTPEEILKMSPTHIVLSPGPGTPKGAGICLQLLNLLSDLKEAIPVLGVCLGHQCLVECFGGRTMKAKMPVHGMADQIRHDGTGIFSNLLSPFPAGRYHSLISVLPTEQGKLLPCAWSEDGELMGVRHVSKPFYGVQFHPESVLSAQGHTLIKRFVSMDVV